MQHLNETQRYTIYRMLKDKKAQSQIAEYVGVSQATISKEIARNKNSLGHYSPKDAQMFAQMRKERFRCNRKLHTYSVRHAHRARANVNILFSEQF